MENYIIIICVTNFETKEKFKTANLKFIQVCMCVCVWVCVCGCIYIYIYIYICMCISHGSCVVRNIYLLANLFNQAGTYYFIRCPSNVGLGSS